MSATVPITSAMVADGQSFQQLGHPAEAPPEVTGVAPARTHSTNVHFGLWMLAAGGVIAAFHLGGFRMAFDVGLGR